MPLLKHAKKKLRQDEVRTERNKKVKEVYKKLIKQAKASKKADDVSKAFSSIDKAAKHHILPKNRASRMKAALSKVVSGKVVKETASNAASAEEPKVTKAVEKKAAPKATKKAVRKVAPKKK